MQTDEQKVQELLKPRYKIIADYPHSPFPVGRLLDGNDESFLVTRTQYQDFGELHFQNNWMPIDYLEKFPHLFCKLEWWEERKPEEMPEYVKPDPNGALEQFRSQKTIYKVRRWVRDDNNLWCEVGDHDHIHVNHIIPATSSEYNNYNNAQKIQL